MPVAGDMLYFDLLVCTLRAFRVTVAIVKEETFGKHFSLSGKIQRAKFGELLFFRLRQIYFQRMPTLEMLIRKKSSEAACLPTKANF